MSNVVPSLCFIMLANGLVNWVDVLSLLRVNKLFASPTWLIKTCFIFFNGRFFQHDLSSYLSGFLPLSFLLSMAQMVSLILSMASLPMLLISLSTSLFSSVASIARIFDFSWPVKAGCLLRHEDRHWFFVRNAASSFVFLVLIEAIS